MGMIIVSLFASGNAMAQSDYACANDSGVCDLPSHTPLPRPIKSPGIGDLPDPRYGQPDPRFHRPDPGYDKPDPHHNSKKYAKPVRGLKPVECSFSIEKGSINADLQTDFDQSTSVSFNNVYSSHACGVTMKKYFNKHKKKVCLQPDTLDSQTVLQVKALGNTTRVAKLDRLLPCDGGIVSPPVIPPVDRLHNLRRPSNYNQVNGSGGTFSPGRTYAQ